MTTKPSMRMKNSISILNWSKYIRCKMNLQQQALKVVAVKCNDPLIKVFLNIVAISTDGYEN